LNDVHAVFRTLLNMPEHVYLTPIPDSTSEPKAFSSRNIPSQCLVPLSALFFFCQSFQSKIPT